MNYKITAFSNPFRLNEIKLDGFYYTQACTYQIPPIKPTSTRVYRPLKPINRNILAQKNNNSPVLSWA